MSTKTVNHDDIYGGGVVARQVTAYGVPFPPEPDDRYYKPTNNNAASEITFSSLQTLAQRYREIKAEIKKTEERLRELNEQKFLLEKELLDLIGDGEK